MNKAIFITSIFALALFVSCDRRNVDPQETLSYSISVERTPQMLWDNGDGVSVFYFSRENELWTFDGQDGSETGVLKSNARRIASGKDIIALYPYDEDAVLKDGVLYTFLPSVQYFGEKNGSIRCAKSDIASLGFKYAVAGVNVTFEKNVDLNAVTLEGADGEILAGQGKITDFADPCLELTGDFSDVVSLCAKDKPYQALANTSIELFAVPCELPDGCTVKYYLANGQEKHQTIEGPVSLSTGEPLLVTTDIQETLELILSFYETTSGGTLTGHNPFTTELSNTMVGALTDNIYLAAYPETYPFRFFVSDSYAAPKLAIDSGGKGLQLGGTIGDYILLPAVKDMRLTTVEITVGASTPSYCISEDSDSGEIIPGGELHAFARNETYVFSLSGSEAGKPCRISSQKRGSAYIKSINLSYQKY